MQLENFGIRFATAEDLNALEGFPETAGQGHDADYFAHQYNYQLEGLRHIVLACLAQEIVGYCILNWAPKYGFFKTMGFPEIQDLNVLRVHRRKGIATAIIAHCEGLARQKKLDYMGIGVGVHSAYGPPQKLYIGLGYVPDGYGVTYDRQQVAFGEFRPVDDELCLMMIKKL